MNNSSRKHSAKKGKKQVESSLVSNSGSMSTSNPAVSLFSKQIADFMRGGNEPIDDEGSSEEEDADSDARPLPKKTGNQKPKIQPKKQQMSSDEDEEDSDNEEEDDDEDESASNEKKKGGAQVGAINEMYQKYKKYQELLAKYSNDSKGAGAADEDSSITISKSQ